MELTILMPCLNEAETLEICIKKALQFLKTNYIEGEVIIADNGSTDGSQLLAKNAGARVVDIPLKGYGSALIGGIESAKGKYIIMGDSDDSYDFSKLEFYLEDLRNGSDLVMGNRFKGGIKPGAMPFLHKYLGNPVLSFIGRLFFKSPIGDFHCGLRGFAKESALKMNLKCTGMEFASEMVVKATLLNFKISEVPTILYPDGRSRPPHLRTWRDGWRHLRFLFMYAPKWLFLYPGIALSIFGLIFSTTLMYQDIIIAGIGFQVNTLIYTSAMVIIGFQSIAFYFLTRIFALQEGFLPDSKSLNNLFKYFNLETGLISSLFLIIAGFSISAFTLNYWNQYNFGAINNKLILRLVILSVTLLVVGFQLFLNSFFFSILGLKKRSSI